MFGNNFTSKKLTIKLISPISLLLVASCALPVTRFDESVKTTSLSTHEKVNLTSIETSKQADELDASDIINRSKNHVTRSGEVYLMRGLANVFSRGIDEIAEMMRDRGIDASNFSYTQWPEIADDIVRRSQGKKLSFPIIIIGHSLGANESSKFANYLGERGVKVARIVTFDPVENGVVGKNIGKVTNYYLPKSEGNQIVASDDFTGEVENIDVSNNKDITHTNIEKNQTFQEKIIDNVLELTSKKRKRAKVSSSEG